MQKLEIEVKFYASRLEGFKEALAQMGVQSSGRAFESNLRFENEEGRLAKNGAMLRLRQTQGVNIITVKQCVPHEAALTCKVFKEYETEVRDFATMRQIFGVLGYLPYQVYEKYRETLHLPDAKICLDETPLGNFVEIEADADVIERYAARLNLDWRERITASYLDIFEMLKQAQNLPFNTFTFDNFNKLPSPVTVESILPRLYAGK